MRITIQTFFLLLALLFFLLAGFNVPTGGRVSWRDLGYASVTASFLVG